MSSNPLISIIIPVYNVEPYVSRCLNSIIRQSYANFEAIIVDDGSPDKSGQICDTFAQSDKRFHVFHQENAGVGAARNTGLSHVNGDWVMFVDPDDELFDDSLESFVKRIRPETEMLMGGFVCCDKDGVITYQRKESFCKQITREKAISLMYKPEVFFALCLICIKLFKTDILRRANLRFDTTIKMNEDTLFSVQYLCSCQQGNICDFFSVPPIYKYYNTREGSATWQSNHDTSQIKIADIFRGNCKALQSVKSVGINNRSTLNLLKLSVYYRYHSCIDSIRKADQNKANELKAEYQSVLSTFERFRYGLREVVKRMIKCIRKR